MATFESKHLWHQTYLQLITAKKNGSSFLSTLRFKMLNITCTNRTSDVQNSFLCENEAMMLDPSKADQVSYPQYLGTDRKMAF